MAGSTKYLGLMARKGGAGKTTFSIHFACLATSLGMRVAMIDLDEQGSLSEWSNDRLAHRSSEEPLVLTVDHSRGFEKCTALCEKHCFDLVIIDTLPGVDPSAKLTAKTADYVVIPCKPGKFDMKAIGDTVDLLQATNTPGGIIVNQGRHNSRINETVLQALEDYRLDICTLPVMQRALIQDSIVDGGTAFEHEPNSRGSIELEHAFVWTMGHLGFDRRSIRTKLRNARKRR